MYSKEEQIKVYVMVGTIIMLLVIFSGITYAFFSANNNQGSTSLIEATSGKMLISYKDGTSDLLVSKDIQPSNNIIIDKTFTLMGTNTTSGLVMPYKIGIKYTNSFSNGQLHYYIKRTTTNSNITSNLIGTASETIPGNTTETGYTTGIFIKNNTESYLELANGEFKANTSNQTITFNLKIQFPDTNENQDNEKGASFTGNIVVNYENETGVDYIARLYNGDKENNGLLADDTKDANIRFSGSDSEVKNYVEFGNSGELWRIIGIFDVKDSETGEYQKKIKLMRKDSIGSYSWDSSETAINGGAGINDWSQSKLMQELNGDYLDTTLTAADEINWYNGKNNQKTGKFDIAKVIKEKYQQMISNNVWNLGASSYSGANPYNLFTLEQYNAERGSVTYQNSRPVVWTGKIGLIYPSDYGYASSDTECRTDLRAGLTLKDNKIDNTTAKCKNNNWISYQWTWTINSYLNSSAIFGIVGYIESSSASGAATVKPSVYLLPTVKIISGDGTSSNPYKLEL